MDPDRLSYTQLLNRLSELHDEADRQARTLLHINTEIKTLELELAKRQTPPDDWE